MDLKRTYGTDRELEVNGVWVELGDGAEVLVARSNNVAFRRALREKLKPYQHQIRRDKLDPEILSKLTRECVAKHVLLDWKGIELDGKKVKYTPEKSLEFLTDYPDFQEDVLDAAGSIETYRLEDQTENLKNSEAS